MQLKADTPQHYIDQLPEDRKPVIQKLRQSILDHLPDGFAETISYGMIAYVVPHSIYPDGYHCDPKQPLPFISIASQKNVVALYHMGLYACPEVLRWFTEEYSKHCKARLDMGKSCIRFKKTAQIPYDLIAGLAGKISVDKWIQIYETSIRR